MYKIIETSFGEPDVIKSFKTRDKALEYFKEIINEFLNGVDGFGHISENSSDRFVYDYEDGDSYTLSIYH